jgi:exodeoxyribonuclease-3
MQSIRIANWNMAYWQHRALKPEAWEFYLNKVDADIFLFQEGCPTEDLNRMKKNIVWSEIGGKRDWGSGIYSSKYELFEEKIDTEFKGVFSIGNTTINNNRITLISMYGIMESSGPTKGYAIPNLHRMLSDLTGLFNGHISGHRNIILGGDLNASVQLDEIQRNNSHKIFFDSIEDFGLNDVYKLSGNQHYVQTLRHARSKKKWQNDYFFLSNSLIEKYRRYKIIDNQKVREFSDHNIVIIELEI